MIYRIHHRATSPRIGRLRVVAALFILLLPAATIGMALAEDTPPTAGITAGTIIINEVKSGGSSDQQSTLQPAQYVTLFNTSDQAVSLTDWRIEYAKQNFPGQYCSASNWDVLAPSMVNLAASTLTIPPQSVSQAIELNINDNDPGSIHIADPAGIIHDTVGWGSSTASAPCFETEPAAELTASKGLQRYLGCVSGNPIDTDDNASDFVLTDTPVAGQKGSHIAPQCAAPSVPNPNTPGMPDGSTPTPPEVNPDECTDVVISELLPNPAGSDSGHEYIEVHNPTETAINLDSCSLQTSASTSYRFDLTGLSLTAGGYLAVTDSASGLTLPNASGGTVWLADASDELQAITYPADMADDASWSLVSGQWALSYTLTPDAANIATPAKPCEDNLVRSPETNRCVKPTADSTADVLGSTAAQLASACKPGQERNPATNRCRTVPGSAPTGGQAACKPGQERNPETNRCRAIATASAAAKACPEGQERNPDTNRCRKVSAAAAGANSTVIDSGSSSGDGTSARTWLVIGLAILLAVGYGIYEWRQEIVLWFKRRSGKLQPQTALPRA